MNVFDYVSSLSIFVLVAIREKAIVKARGSVVGCLSGRYVDGMNYRKFDLLKRIFSVQSLGVILYYAEAPRVPGFTLY